MTKSCLVVVVELAVSGCASNVDVRYPAPTNSSPRTGAVLIRFTEPMRGVSVSIDGVAEDKHTERVHIADVPTGTREISVVAATGGPGCGSGAE